MNMGMGVNLYNLEEMFKPEAKYENLPEHTDHQFEFSCKEHFLWWDLNPARRPSFQELKVSDHKYQKLNRYDQKTILCNFYIWVSVIDSLPIMESKNVSVLLHVRSIIEFVLGV